MPGDVTQPRYPRPRSGSLNLGNVVWPFSSYCSANSKSVFKYSVGLEISKLQQFLGLACILPGMYARPKQWVKAGSACILPGMYARPKQWGRPDRKWESSCNLLISSPIKLIMSFLSSGMNTILSLPSDVLAGARSLSVAEHGNSLPCLTS